MKNGEKVYGAPLILITLDTVGADLDVLRLAMLRGVLDVAA